MTNNPHDMETEPTPHDNGQDSPADEAQMETWQEGLPPDDDFHDQGAAASVSSDDAVVVEESAQAAPAKRGGAGLILGALVVGAVVMGGLAYTQLSGRKDGAAPTVPPVVASADSAPGSTAGSIEGALPGANAPELQPTPTTSEADLSAIYKAARDQTAAADNATVLPDMDNGIRKAADEVKALAVEGAVPNPAPAPIAAVAPPVPVPPAPVPAALAPIAPVVPAQAPTLAVPVPPIAGRIQNATNDAVGTRLDALAARMEAMQKTLDQTVKHTAELASRLDAASIKPMEVGPAPQIEDRLARIEQQLGTRHSAGLSDDKPVQAQGTAASQTTTKAAVRHKASKPTATAHTKKAKPSDKPEATQAASKETWVLRAATPEAAWVSSDVNAPELRKVAVGESLPGIGTVKAINQLGEGWVVVGTKGTIR